MFNDFFIFFMIPTIKSETYLKTKWEGFNINFMWLGYSNVLYLYNVATLKLNFIS